MKNESSLTPAEDQAAPALPTPARLSPVSVTQCGLRLTSVRLMMVVCAPGDEGADVSAEAELQCEAALVEDSLREGGLGFDATVNWSTKFSGAPPIKISGVHRLSFGVREAVDQDSVEYYSQINSVILLYPYLRQLVDDLSAKSLGCTIMTRPLDVVRFIVDREREWRRQAVDGSEGDTEVRGTDATG